MSDREGYRSIGERIVDPRILSDAIGSVDDYPFRLVTRVDLPIAPPSRATSRSFDPSATQNGTSSPDPMLPGPPSSSSFFGNNVPSSPISPSTHEVNELTRSAEYMVGDLRSSSLILDPCDAYSEVTESSNPLTLTVPHASSNRTPRFSISTQSASDTIQNVCSHPSQGSGHPTLSHPPSSQSSHYSATQEPSTSLIAELSGFSPRPASGMGREKSENPTSSTSPSIGASLNSLHERVMPDNASYHTFGRPSVTIGVTGTSPSPGAARRSSTSMSFSTSRSSSHVSVDTFEPFCCDATEFDYNGSHHVELSTEARGPEDLHQTGCRREEAGPSVSLTQLPDSNPPSATSPAPLDDSDSEESGMITFRPHSVSSSNTRTSHSAQAEGEQMVGAGNAYDGFDLPYILPGVSEGSICSFGSRLSFVQGNSGGPLSSHLSSIVPFAVSEGSSPSLPIDESFLKHLHKYDRKFDARRHYWSFTLVKEHPSMSNDPSKQTPPQSPPQLSNTDQMRTDACSRMQETWKCGHVGRFRVKRTVFEPRSTEPAKGVVQQIHIRQLADRNVGTPCQSVIHKHPGAVAFSIFRTSHSLSKAGNEASTSTAAPTYMNIRAGILLAPKKVQQRYASMKSTSKLGTQDGSGAPNKGQSNVASDRKGKGKANPDRNLFLLKPPASVDSSGASSTRSVSTSQLSRMGSTRESDVHLVSPAPSPASDSHASNASENDISSIPLTPIPRAVGALPPPSLNPSRPDTISRGKADSASTLKGRLFRAIRGSSGSDDPSPSLAGMFQSMLSPSRSPQEETELINHLNASFKAVGLLPSRTNYPSASISKRNSDHTFLGLIPEDCLCMTLPLRASETAGLNVQAEDTDTMSHSTIPSDGKFLIVYYVPIEEAIPKDKKPKKGLWQSNPPVASGVNPESKSVYLPAFHVVARVVNDGELLLSGLRVPSGGLVVGGPDREAIRFPSSPSDRMVDLPTTIVCHCHSRERGFDFVEEGLYQLGLCTREEVQTHNFPAAAEEDEGEIVLTPIGRAVLEIIWLGCLAATSFGPV